MKNSYGSAVRVTIFGESHGAAVGAVVDGLAAGLPVSERLIAAEMEKRRAVGAISTSRAETDDVGILSGCYNGHTTGTPLCLLVENRATKSSDYAALQNTPRPGHADYAAHVKYAGFEDARGGGHFSGRVTAAVVAAGAVCRGVLAGLGITVGTHLAACGGVLDASFPSEEAALQKTLDDLNAKAFATISDAAAEQMQAAILAAKADGDSVGGVLETAITGVPAGLGEPFFASVESVLSALFFSIPGVKGVAFGSGFAMASMRGSEAGDPFYFTTNGAVRTRTNHNGGVNGGVANGMPILLRAAVKPTPSIAKQQQTVDLATGEAAALAIRGRHDPCILHRARAVADAMAAIGILDLYTQVYGTIGQRPAKQEEGR